MIELQELTSQKQNQPWCLSSTHMVALPAWRPTWLQRCCPRPPQACLVSERQPPSLAVSKASLILLPSYRTCSTVLVRCSATPSRLQRTPRGRQRRERREGGGSQPPPPGCQGFYDTRYCSSTRSGRSASPCVKRNVAICWEQAAFGQRGSALCTATRAVPRSRHRS